jgi:hypothetical protein
MRRLTRALFWTVTVTFLVVAVFVAVGVVLTKGWTEATECEPKIKCEKLPFDSVEWKAYGDWSNPIRVKMIDDLSASYGVRGKSRDWIDEQLGTPDNTHPFGDLCDYVYWLGPSRQLVVTEFEWLCLNFDADVVVDATIQYSGKLGPS